MGDYDGNASTDFCYVTIRIILGFRGSPTLYYEKQAV